MIDVPSLLLEVLDKSLELRTNQTVFDSRDSKISLNLLECPCREGFEALIIYQSDTGSFNLKPRARIRLFCFMYMPGVLGP